MSVRRRITGWEEQDAYTAWRHFLTYMSRAGKVKAVKRRTHRRERREGAREIQQQLREDRS